MLRGEAGMLDMAPSALEFTTTIKEVVCRKSAMSAAERIHDVRMIVADSINKDGWRRAVRQCFVFGSRYGRLVVEFVLEGFGQKYFASTLSPKPAFESYPVTLIYCMNLWKRCRLSRQRARRAPGLATWMDVV